ncbi:hypothetical protein KBY58_04380 [Cyanobium sp. HWJ4-Hawea]|uniref:hypothetical protein n=1 Tax=Cyanobium sp. HWJ4-Hawea TaxID=2823713 RepID=UPI0020CDB65F|nr:hypothetical protein [Cyanobium sp. HWJ4-Hawea]MCP9808666.1 hypothetical protein [Cyanobium sp. HWJ4-Hawea]
MLTIAVPTYQRPRRLQEFIEHNYPIIKNAGIKLSIFHNEPAPDYDPTYLNIDRHYMNTNTGWTGNARKIISCIKEGYCLIASDEERFSPNQLCQLAEIASSDSFGMVFLNRGCDNSKQFPLESQSQISVLKLLKSVPFTEACWLYNTRLSNSIGHPKLSSTFIYKTNPPLSLLLSGSALSNHNHAVMDKPLLMSEPLGSVKSGWTSWPPNILITHLYFIKFSLYFDSLLGNTAADNSLAMPLLPGFINHIRLCCAANCYVGPTLASAVLKACKMTRIYSNYSDLLDYFLDYNDKSLATLPSVYSSEYTYSKKSRSLFSSIYPEWCHASYST